MTFAKRKKYGWTPSMSLGANANCKSCTLLGALFLMVLLAFDASYRLQSLLTMSDTCGVVGSPPVSALLAFGRQTWP